MTKLQFSNKSQITIFKHSKLSGVWCLVLGICLVFGAWCLIIPVRAQSPSPETSPSAEETTEEETKDQLNEKIKDIREAVQEKVREKLESVQKGQKRAFVGEINEINDSILTLTTREGEKQAKLDEETIIINEERKQVDLEDLEIGIFIIAMGYLEDEDNLTTARVVETSKPEPIVREVAFGKVTDISEENILTVKNEKKGITYTVEATGKTKITQKIEGETKEIKFADIVFGDRLVAVGSPTENEEKIITAKLIHVVPASPPAGGPSPESEIAVEETTPSPSPAEEEVEEETP